jgi:hypothetical protein
MWIAIAYSNEPGQALVQRQFQPADGVSSDGSIRVVGVVLAPPPAVVVTVAPGTGSMAGVTAGCGADLDRGRRGRRERSEGGGMRMSRRGGQGISGEEGKRGGSRCRIHSFHDQSVARSSSMGSHREEGGRLRPYCSHRERSSPRMSCSSRCP